MITLFLDEFRFRTKKWYKSITDAYIHNSVMKKRIYSHVRIQQKDRLCMRLQFEEITLSKIGQYMGQLDEKPTANVSIRCQRKNAVEAVRAPRAEKRYTSVETPQHAVTALQKCHNTLRQLRRNTASRCGSFVKTPQHAVAAL